MIPGQDAPEAANFSHHSVEQRTHAIAMSTLLKTMWSPDALEFLGLAHVLQAVVALQ